MKKINKKHLIIGGTAILSMATMATMEGGENQAQAANNTHTKENTKQQQHTSKTDNEIKKLEQKKNEIEKEIKQNDLEYNKVKEKIDKNEVSIINH